MITNREARIAANEVLFRQLNERIADLLDEIGDDAGRFDIICECGSDSCDAKLTVPRDLYENVRQHPARFIVVKGHVAPDVESVVEEHGTFQIVEKHPEEAVIARATDPRA